MGCAASTTSGADAQQKGASAPSTDQSTSLARRTTRSSLGDIRRLTIRSRQWRNSTSEGQQSYRRSSSTGDRLSGLFGHRHSNHRNSANDSSHTLSKETADPLGLGTETNVVTPPTQWIVVLGERGSGKSTLIRQLKVTYDGIDIPEAIRFHREVHKTAIALFKRVLTDCPVAATDTLKAASERVLKMKRRELITEHTAQDIKLLFDQHEVQLTLASLADLQARKAAAHFAARVDVLASPEYVPEPRDLLHLAVPTVGQHETRVQNFPAGQLSAFETNSELRRSSIMQTQASMKHSELFGPGLRGIVFVASALSFELSCETVSRAPNRRSSAHTSRRSKDASKRVSDVAGSDSFVSVRPDLLRQWQGACALAAKVDVPCMLVLSKCDLLASVKLPPDLRSAQVSSILRRQYFSELSSVITNTRGSQVDKDKEDSSTAHDIVYASKSEAVSLVGGLGSDFENDEDQGKVSDLVIRQAFPQLQPDHETVGLGESVYLCLTYFCPPSCSMLSHRGVLPVSKWKSGVLTVQDHVWLHELPQPLPNPRCVDEDTALRLGKASTDPLRSAFWTALHALAEQLGSFEPENMGMLHSTPLLTTSGALLIVVRAAYSSAPDLGPNRRSLSWIPVTRVATKVARVAQAGEHLVSDTMDASTQSYAQQVREMLATTPARELMPHIWLAKLQEACKEDGSLRALTPGTYMVAFYTKSTRTGLRILLSAKGLNSLPPCVKISSETLSAVEWSQICDLDTSLRNEHAHVCDSVLTDWAAAKGWMGPDVGGEKQFSIVQKFFYGITSLRQRLEVMCTAMRDEIRHSAVDAAATSMSALGEVFRQEIVLADPEGKVQLIIIGKHLSVDDTQTFPASMQWHPFPIFEARHYNTFLPGIVNTIGLGKALVQNGTSLHVGLERLNLRDSDLRSSAGSSCTSLHSSAITRKSLASTFDAARKDTLALLTGKPKVEHVGETFNKALQVELNNAWDALRWTKRAALAFCRATEHDGAVSEGGGKEDHAGKRYTLSSQQRVKEHLRANKQVTQHLLDCVSKLRMNVQQLKEAMQQYKDSKQGA